MLKLLWCVDDNIVFAAIQVLYSLIKFPPCHRGVFAFDSDRTFVNYFQMHPHCAEPLFDILSAYNSSFRLTPDEVIYYTTNILSNDINKRILDPSFSTRRVFLDPTNQRNTYTLDNDLHYDDDEVTLQSMIAKESVYVINDILTITPTSTSTLSTQKLLDRHVSLGVSRSHCFSLLWRIRLQRMQATQIGAWNVYKLIYQILTITFSVKANEDVIVNFFEDKPFFLRDLLYMYNTSVLSTRVPVVSDSVYNVYDNQQGFGGMYSSSDKVSQTLFKDASYSDDKGEGEGGNTEAMITDHLIPSTSAAAGEEVVKEEVPEEMVLIVKRCLATIMAHSVDEVSDDDKVVNGLFKPFKTLTSALGLTYGKHSLQYRGLLGGVTGGSFMMMFRHIVTQASGAFELWLDGPTTTNTNNAADSVLLHAVMMGTRQAEEGIFMVANALNLTGVTAVLLDEGLADIIMTHLEIFASRSSQYDTARIQLIQSLLTLTAPVDLETPNALSIMYQQWHSHCSIESFLVQILDSIEHDVPRLLTLSTLKFLTLRASQELRLLCTLDDMLDSYCIQTKCGVNSVPSQVTPVINMILNCIVNYLSLFLSLISNVDYSEITVWMQV